MISGRQRAPRVEASARLTAVAGLVLLVLLAAEGVTIVSIRRLLPLHYFIGLLLIPPLLLKLATTGTRFVRYYRHDREYRAAGPPEPLLRATAPLLVISTVVVLGTGVELWLAGERFGTVWLTAHKASFVIWFCLMAIHVLGHAQRAPALALRDLVNRPAVRGRASRGAWVAGSVLMGVVLAASVLIVQSAFVIPLEHG